jgi:pimeloyl-ACP methyl ester carboxylesterase
MGKLTTRRIVRWALAVVLGLLLLGTAFVYFVLPGWVASGLAGAKPRPPERTPQAYRLDFEDVVLPADGGVTLAGWLLPPQRPRETGAPALGTVVMSHGVHKNREQVMDRAGFLSRGGYRVLLFDLRGHGASTPAPLTAGLREAEDYAAALRFLDTLPKQKGPRVLFGLSLSAMAAVRALAGGLKADALVADSPLPDAGAYLARRTAAGPFMGWPGFFERCLAEFNRRTGMSMTAKDMDLLPVVRGVRVPVMVIAGEKDDLAPAREVQRMFNALGTPTRRLLYVPEAGHDETYRKFRIMYERAVLEFLRDVREGFPEPRSASRPAKVQRRPPKR